MVFSTSLGFMCYYQLEVLYQPGVSVLLPAGGIVPAWSVCVITSCRYELAWGVLCYYQLEVLYQPGVSFEFL